LPSLTSLTHFLSLSKTRRLPTGRGDWRGWELLRFWLVCSVC
jgi:hypothetical protein